MDAFEYSQKQVQAQKGMTERISRRASWYWRKVNLKKNPYPLKAAIKVVKKILDSRQWQMR